MTSAIQDEKNLHLRDSAVEQPLAEFDLLLNLYRSLVESPDLAAGVASALATVCRFTGWDLGLAWLPSKDQSALELFSSWHRGDAELGDFTEVCQSQTYALGAGITGRVWQKGEAEWMSHLTVRPPELFPLAPLAAKAGIKATLAVPVRQDDRVLGVLVFCTRQVKAEDDRLVEVVSRVATQLGFALRHKQIEENLRHQEALLHRSRDELELRVSQRTVQLTITNEALQAEIFERKRLQEEMLSWVREQETVVFIGQRALSGVKLPLLLQEAYECV
jgi:GAF domain-containing protein